MENPDDRPSKRARKACTECRQQKARCDAYLSPGDSCTRCRKMGVQCLISDPFKREHKRKKLSELEQEAAVLRKRLETARPNSDSSPTSPETVMAAQQSPMSNGNAPRLSMNSIVKPVQMPLGTVGPPVFNNATPIMHFRPSVQDPTSSQSLEGVKLDGSTIDEIFHHYFETFSRYLPILDASRSPNSYYSELPLLFWSIIGVSSRTYRDEKVLKTLAPKIIRLACLSLQYTAKQSTLPIIKSFILLLTWPFPRRTQDTEVTFPFAGTLIHMALQIGLHIPAATQDFSRVKVKLTQEDITSRCELWAYCVIAYQSDICMQQCASHAYRHELRSDLMDPKWTTVRLQVYLIGQCACVLSLPNNLHNNGVQKSFEPSDSGTMPQADIYSASLSGQYPASSFDRSYDLDKTLHERVSPTLKFQLHLHRLERRCCAAMQDLGLLHMTSEKEMTLDVLIRVFESQLKDVENSISSEFDRFFYATTRHIINIFHFFKTSVATDLSAGTRIYTTACGIIEQFNQLDRTGLTLSASPNFFIHSLMMATSSLVRLLKSSFSQYVDMEMAKANLFSGFDIARKLSIGNVDLGTKFIPVITQLWNSDRAFKKPDGSEFIALRIRTRMMMSSVYDTLWWWREEYGGQAGAYSTSTEGEQLGSAKTPSTDQAMIDSLGADQSIWFGFMEPYHFPNDQTFAEFGWPVDYNVNENVGTELNTGWTS